MDIKLRVVLILVVAALHYGLIKFGYHITKSNEDIGLTIMLSSVGFAIIFYGIIWQK